MQSSLKIDPVVDILAKTMLNKSKTVYMTNNTYNENGRSSLDEQEANNSVDTINRLLDYKKRTQEKLKLKILLKKQHEGDMLQEKPSISVGSQKLISQSDYKPIYSKQRIKQINDEKSKKMEKLRQETEKRKLKLEKESIKNSFPQYKNPQIASVKLCFDPNDVKSMINKPNINSKFKKNLEDEELKLCSFKPTTDRNSDLIFSKLQKSKTVVERLIDYGKQKEDRLKKKIKEYNSQFTPQGLNKKKRIPKSKITTIGKQEDYGIDIFVNTILNQIGNAETIANDKPDSLANTSLLSKYVI